MQDFMRKYNISTLFQGLNHVIIMTVRVEIELKYCILKCYCDQIIDIHFFGPVELHEEHVQNLCCSLFDFLYLLLL